MRIAQKSSLAAAVAIFVATASTGSAFTAPTTVTLSTRDSSASPTARFVSVLPVPTAEELNKVQPELGEDDLYMGMDDEIQKEVPRAGTIMKMLPEETWDIDTPTSLFYFAVDGLAVAATMGFLNSVVTSDIYHSAPVFGQALMVAPLQVLTGFAMWCMWCIGHDAGHSTVSKSKWVNRVVGEVAHSMVCLTPFVPWALSHKKHHLGHNHLERDYSHQWYVEC